MDFRPLATDVGIKTQKNSSTILIVFLHLRYWTTQQNQLLGGKKAENTDDYPNPFTAGWSRGRYSWSFLHRQDCWSHRIAWQQCTAELDICVPRRLAIVLKKKYCQDKPWSRLGLCSKIHDNNLKFSIFWYFWSSRGLSSAITWTNSKCSVLWKTRTPFYRDFRNNWAFRGPIALIEGLICCHTNFAGKNSGKSLFFGKYLDFVVRMRALAVNTGIVLDFYLPVADFWQFPPFCTMLRYFSGIKITSGPPHQAGLYVPCSWQRFLVKMEQIW